jgi:hypothetical protein
MMTCTRMLLQQVIVVGRFPNISNFDFFQDYYVERRGVPTSLRSRNVFVLFDRYNSCTMGEVQYTLHIYATLLFTLGADVARQVCASRHPYRTSAIFLLIIETWRLRSHGAPSGSCSGVVWLGRRVCQSGQVLPALV